jgi:hypothetical protein
MTQLSLDPRFDFIIYALQVCTFMLSLNCRKKRGITLILLDEDPQIPHILGSEFYFKNL